MVFIASFPEAFSCTVASHLDPLGYFEPTFYFFISHLALKQTQDIRRQMLTMLFIAVGVGHADLVSVNHK